MRPEAVGLRQQSPFQSGNADLEIIEAKVGSCAHVGQICTDLPIFDSVVFLVAEESAQKFGFCRFHPFEDFVNGFVQFTACSGSVIAAFIHG
jgi:hypothetical protein